MKRNDVARAVALRRLATGRAIALAQGRAGIALAHRLEAWRGMYSRW